MKTLHEKTNSAFNLTEALRAHFRAKAAAALSPEPDSEAEKA